MIKTSTKILSVILFLVGTVSAFAIDVSGTPPTFSGTGADVSTFNTAISNAFNQALGEVRDMVKDIDSKPEKFIQSWGNSQVFASHGATMRGYGEYKLFTFSVGSMVGAQLPSSIFNIMNEFENIPKKLNDDKDISLGGNPQMLNARLGINTSKFLLKDLYLGLHLGFIKLDGDNLGLKDFNFESFTLGVTANYQLIPHLKLAGGLLQWRGVNVGSGLIYSGTKIGYSMKLDSQKQSFSGSYNIGGYNGTITGDIIIDPKVILDMNISTITIPLEATTAVKLLWFLNIPFGVGVDLGFGKSDMKVGMEGDVNVTGIPSAANLSSTPGNLSVTAGGDMAPKFFNPKLMTGVGFNFGPVVIDIPLTFYLDNGYNVGVTVGIVW